MMSILVKKEIQRTSIFLILLGFFLGVCWPQILHYLMKRDLTVDPGTTGFRNWERTPVPVYLDFYFFNWTNADNFPNEKPNFTELGPYRYYEERFKVNLTWNDNGTVTFRQVRRWFFREAESKGSESDIITTLNVVALTAAYMVRNHGYIHQKSVNTAFWFTGQTLAVSKSVQELLFEGYDDSLMSFAVHISPDLFVLSSPFDKFAWFYKRNGSHTPDGWFNMNTGAHSINDIGSMTSWNFSPKSKFYPDKCGQVSGSTGDMFPPGQKRDTAIRMYSIDLCRTLPFEYDSDSDVQGLTGYRYTAGNQFLDSGNIDPTNSCYCNGDCVPSGLLNVSACRFGAPVFVSFPHFYFADPQLLDDVEGMHPDKEKHQFYFTLEPVTGIPIEVKARLQINLLLQPIRNIGIYKQVPTLFMPILWVDQSIQITDELALPLRVFLMCREWSNLLAVAFLIVGLGLLGLTYFARSRTKRRNLPRYPS
uniref:Uncharacterized protein n=1 Tax=Clastoptera arizonana TaxID=38151 RepID=A0A1B6DBG4_9HEMI